MVRLVLTPAALSDADQIFDRLASEAGRSVAAKYRASFDDLFRLLRDYPEIGPSRPRLGLGVRVGVVDPYLAIYRYDRDAVTVLRIVHGRRRITGAMLRPRATNR
jgi:toxin ParE1/3/4